MEQILAYITQYGLPVFVIASCIIAFIGILKICKIFDKITNKDIKKFIYYALDIGLSFGAVAIYYVIFKIDFGGYIPYCCTQITATTVLYALYENFGVRKIVKALLHWVATWFKKNPDHTLVKTLHKLGLTEEAVKRIQATVDAEKPKTTETNKQ